MFKECRSLDAHRLLCICKSRWPISWLLETHYYYAHSSRRVFWFHLSLVLCWISSLSWSIRFSICWWFLGSPAIWKRNWSPWARCTKWCSSFTHSIWLTSISIETEKTIWSIAFDLRLVIDRYNVKRWGSDSWVQGLKKSSAKDGAMFKNWKYRLWDSWFSYLEFGQIRFMRTVLSIMPIQFSSTMCMDSFFVYSRQHTKKGRISAR